jgi:hypothetical protein
MVRSRMFRPDFPEYRARLRNSFFKLEYFTEFLSLINGGCALSLAGTHGRHDFYQAEGLQILCKAGQRKHAWFKRGIEER